MITETNIAQNFHAGGSGHDQGRSEEKGLILPGGMKAQVGRCIQMTIVISSGMLMRLKMRCGIKRKHMMLMIEFMSENFAVKGPAECVRQHGNEQYQHYGMNTVALIHGFKDSIPRSERCQ